MKEGSTSLPLLLLAAGAGTRLQQHTSKPKPLHELLGLTLLERALLCAHLSVGAQPLYVVVGYRASEIKEFLTSNRVHPLLRKLPIVIIENIHWQKGNGSSILAARAYMNHYPCFLMLMCDHLFDAPLLKKLLSEGLPLIEKGAAVVLASYLAPPPSHIDLQDVTKVMVEQDGRITRIGKNISQYNAFDTGAFLCTSEIFTALSQICNNNPAHNSESCTLSAGIQHLANLNRAYTVAVNPHWWVDIDTVADLHAARKLLLASLHKPTDGPVSRLLNRPLSTRISALLTRMPLTPNHLTLISFFVAVIGAVLVSIPHKIAILGGGILAHLSSVLDGCDGEIARLKFLSSEKGAWIDAVLDRYADILLLTAMGLHVLLGGSDLLLTSITNLWQEWTVWGGVLLGVSGSLLNSYTADKYDGYIRRHKGKPPRIGRDVRLLLVSVGCILFMPVTMLWIIGIINHVETLRRVLVVSRESAL